MATITGTGGNDNLFGTQGGDTIFGLGGDDWIQALGGADSVAGGAGNDALDGGADGVNLLVGQTGNDTYVVFTGDVISEALNEGTDRVLSFSTWDMQTDAVNVENIRLVSAYTITFVGTTMVLTTAQLDAYGNALNNTMEGDSNYNTLAGRAGNDTYIVHDLPGIANVSDTIVEVAGEGNDTILYNPYTLPTTTTYVLADSSDPNAQIENLTLGGTFALNATGNALDNTLTGNTGTNTLIGLGGNDTYVIQSTSDKFIEAAGSLTAGGVDTVQCGVSFSLALFPDVENITLTGSSNIYAIGNAAVNFLRGNTGNNTLSGMTGADTYFGDNGNDTYLVDNTSDTVWATFTFTGTNGVDTILTDGGIDLIQATLTVGQTYDMHLNATEDENLTLLGTAASNVIGNSKDNVITGNSGVNVIDAGGGGGGGAGGNDTLFGGLGNDTLYASGGSCRLDGGGGADTMFSSSGDDTFYVDNAGDRVLSGVTPGGIDAINSTVSFNMFIQSPSSGQRALNLVGSLAINGVGNDLSDIITGNAATNTITGGAGDDTIIGGGGTDHLFGGDGIDSMTGGSVNDVMDGGNGDDSLSGGGGADTLAGGAGNDVLDDGSGAADLLKGGTGDDLYKVAKLGDTFVEGFNQGTDTIRATLSFALPAFDTVAHTGAEIENLLLFAGTVGTGNALNNVITGNGGGNTLYGLGGDDLLVGGGGNDTFDGGAGNDTMVGDAGNDVFYANSAGDSATGNGGTDIVFSSIDFNMSTNAPDVDNLTLTGTTAVFATGNAVDNVITGNGILNTLTGGDGNDTYVMNNITDHIIEVADTSTVVGAGTKDAVFSSVTFDLSAALYAAQEIEDLTLTGTGNINGTGNTLDNIITGNAGINTLDGGAGNDTYVLGAQDILHTDTILTDSGGTLDTVSVAADYTIALRPDLENITLTGSGNFNATGNGNVNILIGNSGSNTLDAGVGADTYYDSLGNDFYVADNANDTVIADATISPPGGTDTILASVSYDMTTLAVTVDNLTLTGSASINGTGNDLNNIITSNTGIDTLTGGAGNDTYMVSNTADSVVETDATLADMGGTDLVISSAVTFTITDANVEKLTLQEGTGAISGTGNASVNVITGNSSANTLDGQAGNDTIDGGAGADTMIGGAGNDTFIVDSLTDVVVEAGGGGTADLIKTGMTYNLSNDIFASVVQDVENLTLTGAANINGTGNNLANTLTGNSGVNILDGGIGADTMNGGGGNDTYLVDNAIDVVASGTGLVLASVDYDMSSHATTVNNLTLVGTATSGTGNSISNIITTNNLVNTVDGSAGNDTLLLHNAADVVLDADSTLETDLIIIDTATIGGATSYHMDTNAVGVKALTITGAGNFDVYCNDLSGVGPPALGDTLTGNSGVNHFYGGAGDDTFYVGTNDFVMGTGSGRDAVAIAFSLSLLADEALGVNAHWKGVENIILTGTTALNATGDTSVNTLTGNSGINILSDGGYGGIGFAGDTLIGCAGNDTYYVNNSADVINEITLGGAGTDIVFSTVSYGLSQSVDNLTLVGAGMNLDGGGNTSNNIIVGTSGANFLDGGAGSDTLNGGAGNDTYGIDSASDTILDSGGVDTVISSMSSYTLLTGMENLTLSGTLPSIHTGIGNTVANIITGNQYDNTLDGKTGADTMYGGDGNDTFFVDSLLDVVHEVADTSTVAGAGAKDLIITSLNNYVLSNSEQVENLTLTGTAVVATGNDLDNYITGNAVANTLHGGNGNDVLDGGLGKDVYYGGAGGDTFVVGSDATTNPEVVKDFDQGNFGIGNIDFLEGDTILFGVNMDPLVSVLEDYVAARYDPTALGGVGATYFYIDRDGISVNGAHFLLALTVEGVDITSILA